jgi:hypothetical protein
VTGISLFIWQFNRPVDPRSLAATVAARRAGPAAEKRDRDTVLHFVPATAGIYELQLDGAVLGKIAAQPEGLYLSLPFKRGSIAHLTVSLYSDSAVDPSLPRGCSGDLCVLPTVPGDRKVAEMHFKLSRFVTAQIWEFKID